MLLQCGDADYPCKFMEFTFTLSMMSSIRQQTSQPKYPFWNYFA